MSRRALLRAALWSVVALDVALGCWWLLATGDADPGRPARTHTDRAVFPPLPPRRPPPRAEPPAPESTAAKPVAASAARPAASGPSHVVLRVADMSKAPLSGVTVVATEANGAVRSTATGADGVARFENVTPEAVEFVLRSSGFATQSVRSVALESGECTITLTMTRGRAVEGVVLESDGTPIAGATVAVGDSRAWPETAASGHDGRFRITAVPEWLLTLDVSAPLYTSARTRVEKGRASVEVRLEPACRLYGTVCDPGGSPVGDALVTAIPEGDADRSRAQRGWTGTDGTYSIDGMPLGISWVVEATRPGFAPAVSSSPVLLDADHRSTWCNLAMRRAARVTVRVVDDEGNALPDVVVEAGLGPNRWFTRRPTDADGLIAFDVPGAGTCRIAAHEEGAGTWSSDIELAEGDVRSLELRRPQPGAVAGIVVDDTGHPVADALVCVRVHTTRTDRDGMFRVEGVLSGPFDVDASADGHVTVRKRTVGAPGEDVRIELARMGSISFRLRAQSRTSGHFDAQFLHDRPTLSPLTKDAWDGHESRIPASPGDGRLVLHAIGFLPVEREVTVRPGEDTPLGEIVLDEGITIEVRVTDVGGKPIAGAMVSSSHAPLDRQPSTDTEGIARIEHVDPAMRDLVLTVGTMSVFETVTVKCDPVASPVDVTLRRLGWFSLKVKDAAGARARDVATKFESLDQSSAEFQTDFGSSNRRRFRWAGDDLSRTWLPVGRWRIRVARGEETLATRDVDVKPGENPAVEITLEK